MKKNIEKRKGIIKSLKPAVAWNNKSLEKRVRFLQGITIVYIILATICAGVLVVTILSEILGFKFTKWENIGIIAILNVGFVLNLPNQIYELRLTKHHINLNSSSNLNDLENLNYELKKIIDKINDRFKSNWLSILIAVVILVLGIWQVGTENDSQIWNYMKLPIIIFYGIILFKFWKINTSLNNNIKDAEHTLKNNTYN